jgi:hypothetical protein
MKFNIFATILLISGLNTNMIMGGEGNGTNQGGTSSGSCHGDFVSSEFN